MKKVITISLLLVTLLAGGMSLDAKTTKKKAKAKTSQNSRFVNDGVSKLNYETFFSGNEEIEFKNLSEIESALYDAGFKLKSSSPYKFTCNGTSIMITCDSEHVYGIDINFKNEKTSESFVDKMQSSGFRYVTDTASGLEYFDKNDIEMIVSYDNYVSLSRK